MADSSLNISIPDFISAISNDYDTACDITLSHNATSLDVGSSITITAESNLASPAGYIYAYSTNPSAVKVTQNTFGSNVTVEAIRLAEGIVNIVFFCGNGETKTIEVYSGDGSNFIWVIGTTESDGKYHTHPESARLTPFKATGELSADVDTNNSTNVPNDFIGSTLYLPKIPSGATSMTIPAHDSDVHAAPALFASNGERLCDPGYGTSYIDLTQYPEAVYYSANVKVAPAANSYDTKRFSVDPTSENYAYYAKVAAIKDFVFN
jgi:hypothetical protein